MEEKKVLPLNELLDTLSEKQATFILNALVTAGYVSRELLEDAIKLSRWVKP
ncbi:hypothetical protein [Tautonia marina]|uniref:hypothetical protein n=1 Tax=Tautonia marina TaxID=2653855 RepID=UPI001375C953|nr:hypothetical protein [Tautonia marina]